MVSIRKLLAGLLLVIGLTGAAPPPVPPLPDTARFTPYSVSSAVGPFAVGFAIYGDSSDYTNWISVTLNGVVQSGNWTLDSPSGALITLARPITDARVTFTSPITGTLVITSAQRPRRLAQNAENRGVTARDFNQTYTAVIAMLREGWDLRSRILLIPPGETMGPLPSQASRSLQMLGFDASGNPIAAQPSSALVSSAMQDVTAAASHAAALTLLGGAPVSAIIPIGGEIDWPGLTVPPLWLPSDHSTRLRASFPELYAVLAPPMTAVVTSGLTAVTGISSTLGFNSTWPVEGPCIAPGTTIVAVPGSTSITLSAPAICSGVLIIVYPHGSGDGVTTFNLPDSLGMVYAGFDPAGTRLPEAINMARITGNQNQVLAANNLPAHAHSITDPGHTHALVNAGNVTTGSVFGAGAGTTGGANVAITVTAASTGITGTNNNVTTNDPFRIVQPTAIRRKIIYAGH